MLWLGRRIIALCLSLIVLIGGVVSYSRAHAGPSPLNAYGLDVCDGKPCFMGITPGVTSWEDALPILDKHGHTIEAGIHRFSVGTWQFSIGKKAGQTRVAVVGGQRSHFQANDFPQIGNVLVQYGMPCSVDLVGYSLDGLQLNYPLMAIGVDIHPEKRVTAYSAIVSITLIDTLESPQDNQCNNQGQGLSNMPWLGFASLDRYRAHWLALAPSH